MEQDQLDNILRFIAAASYQCERATETARNVANSAQMTGNLDSFRLHETLRSIKLARRELKKAERLAVKQYDNHLKRLETKAEA